MRLRYALAALVAVALVAGAVWVWRPVPGTTPTVVQNGETSIRIDRVTITTQEYAGLTAFPPAWVLKVPGAGRLWVATHRKYNYIGDGLKVVLVEGAVATPQPLGQHDLEVRIVCGDYTMGTSGIARNIGTAGPEETFSSRTVLGAHMPVVAVEVRVGEKWIRAWNAK